jgi:hypothetical protein
MSNTTDYIIENQNLRLEREKIRLKLECIKDYIDSVLNEIGDNEVESEWLKDYNKGKIVVLKSIRAISNC